MKNPFFFKSAILCFIVLSTSHLMAQSITPFSIWKQVTQRGDVTFTGNSMLTCNGAGACNANRAAVSPTGSGGGNTFNNNGYTMIYSNIADATDAVTRFSRSNANLTLGSTGGCGVIYAELFWGGSISAATTNYAKRDSVYLKSPVGGYVGLKADIKTEATIPFTGYYCYKDVTNIVRAGGTGTYWLANEVLQTGATGLCGGWTLVVIYSDPVLPLRNLSIFRGISSINATNPQNIILSGFYTPPSPAVVNLKLGVYSLEGDRGTLGDSLKFNGNPGVGFLAVSDAKNANNNIFNSTINNNTAEITRNPNYANTMGMDLDIFVPNNTSFNYLQNGASSATIRMTSSGDVYAPFMLSTAIDVFEPLVEIDKAVIDINGGAVELGDTLQFNLKVVNKGNDPANAVILHDSLYGAMNYVPNSLVINSGANAGPKTDAAGDDQAEFALDGNVNYVKFRLGSGANAANGGAMGITAATDSVTTMQFKVTVTTDCQIFHCNSNLVNKAYVTFVGNISGASRSTYSSPTGVDQYGCPALGPTTLLVNVPPCTPPADSSIVGCSPYALSDILPFRPGYNQFYNSTWASVTNATTTGTYYAIKELYPGCNDTIQLNMTLPCLVPVLLSNFNAAYQNKQVNLVWITQQEINNKEFRLERSVDGIHFEAFATIAGALNSSSAKTYFYTDVNFPHLSKIFYRLIQVDIDGSERISSVKTVTIKDFKSSPINIYSISPNPVEDIASVLTLADEEADYTFKLFSNTGQLVHSEINHLYKGKNSTSIQYNNTASGFYILEVQNKNNLQKAVHKLMIK
jgi:uncharacterized repeat protein (TIGR01451 family)